MTSLFCSKSAVILTALSASLENIFLATERLIKPERTIQVMYFLLSQPPTKASNLSFVPVN